MTSYNYGIYIRDAISSVMNQSYQDWELIIVDDGSKDNSIEIINGFISENPQKIKLLTHLGNENKGIKQTNELAFSNISGKYVAFLESDDVWKPNCLELKISALKNNPEAVLAFSDLELLIDDGFDAERHQNYLKYSRYIGNKCKKNPKSLARMILFRNPIISFSNIVIRSSILQDFSIIKEHEIWSDWQLVIHAAGLGKFIYVENKLLYWRLHRKSQNFHFIQSNINEKKHEFLKSVSRVINQKNMPKKYYYPFSFISKIYKVLHDLKFAICYPNIVWTEFKRIDKNKL